jgi:histidine triad (HIT) family protein
LADKTLFERISSREIPADIVYEDGRCIAFRDINPQAPMHILVCPKKVITMVSNAVPEDAELLGHLLLVAARIAATEGYGDAFRLAINNGSAVGQTVFHLHVHVLGGRRFTWPPG